MAVGIFAGGAIAASEGQFPADWKKWDSLSTTLTKIGALPGCEANVSTLPPIYQETVATYCAVRQGGPGKVAVLVNPASKAGYEARKGKFKDGSNLILHLQDMKVLFVTSHKGGKAQYGIFTEDGKDISAASGPLAIETCKTCHTGYAAFCVDGQCGKISK
ncbi:MAG: hypothetical protein HZA04_10475 [Nitrospinae bacterium]|nr:hypothetical protein [Nitrospinota bacterium]